MILNIAFIWAALAFASAPQSITCTLSNLPSGTATIYIISRQEGGSKLLRLQRNSLGQGKVEVLAESLRCVDAKSDFRVLSCIRESASHSDGSLSLHRHTYMSPGPVKRDTAEKLDAITEEFRFYFRDDRISPPKELKWSARLSQCREATPGELALADKNSL